MADFKEIKKEKAYLVCAYVNMDNSEYRSKELELLSESAYYDIAKLNVFLVKEVNARTYMGIGKVEEIRDEVANLNAEVVIFDCPLTGSQLRNLTEIIGVRCIDRTMLILDIFAGRAKSKEGKLQVELAQLKYALPRLNCLKMDAEKVSGKGLGEKLKDLDKRKIQEDIAKLEREIKEVQKHRQTTRKQRLTRMKSVALVGYTNAGKSTLMNSIAKADTYADNRLFATLDVLTKKVWDDGVEYVLIDTVGFVSNLPHELMYAFSATLEETIDANVLLLVVDASDDHKYEQIEVVEREFNRLGVEKGQVILVYNKIDKVADINSLKTFDYSTCYIGAKTGKNIDKLKEMIKHKISLNY
ncbi:MAG: GTPase HflX [Clostridiales bacterium]|nr:GTPase HflX [Clostridiales bacterium]